MCSYEREEERDLTQGGEKATGSWAEIDLKMLVLDFWDCSDGATSQGMPAPRGSKLQGMDSPLESLKGMYTCWHLDLAPVTLTLYFDFQNCKE